MFFKRVARLGFTGIHALNILLNSFQNIEALERQLSYNNNVTEYPMNIIANEGKIGLVSLITSCSFASIAQINSLSRI